MGKRSFGLRIWDSLRVFSVYCVAGQENPGKQQNSPVYTGIYRYIDDYYSYYSNICQHRSYGQILMDHVYNRVGWRSLRLDLFCSETTIPQVNSFVDSKHTESLSDPIEITSIYFQHNLASEIGVSYRWRLKPGLRLSTSPKYELRKKEPVFSGLVAVIRL